MCSKRTHCFTCIIFLFSKKCTVCRKGVSEKGHRDSQTDILRKVVLISWGSHSRGLIGGFNK